MEGNFAFVLHSVLPVLVFHFSCSLPYPSKHTHTHTHTLVTAMGELEALGYMFALCKIQHNRLSALP